MSNKKWQQSLILGEQTLSDYDKGFSKLSVKEQLSKLGSINTHIKG